MVTNQGLTFSPVEDEQTLLERMEEMAVRALERLPHTPISAVGINFEFQEIEPDQDLLSLFRFADTGGLSDNEFLIQRSSVQRRLMYGDDLNLNLTLTNERSVISFGFNFHQDVDSARAAQEWLQGKVSASRTKALEVLRDVYNCAELDPSQ